MNNNNIATATPTESKKPTQRNQHLNLARVEWHDDFFTKLRDIESECNQYAEHFRGKHVLCPCDAPGSHFLKYFEQNFDEFGLASLTGIGFRLHRHGVKYVKHPNELPQITSLSFDGDFRSREGLIAIDQADIIVSNPPFSQFRYFVENIVRYEKKFLILGSLPTIVTKEIRNFIKTRQMWFGYSECSAMDFAIPEHYKKYARIEKNADGTTTKIARVPAICWLTNLPVDKVLGHQLTVSYNPGIHKKYDKPIDVDAIEVAKLRLIPRDFYGIMSVPISFLLKWDPQQFEVLGFSHGDYTRAVLKIDGKKTFKRVFIRRR